jgi:alcohol dehydrogenase class IV
MDLGKAVALLASQGGSFSDYNVKTGGSAAIRRVLPHVAIPTAAGTGAEIGRACVLTTDDGRKTVVVNLEMVAHSIICDPELTLTSPAWLTAATGIDALSHGIETFLSPNFNPPAEAIALDCITRITGNIERATSKGDDLGARTEMLMAALEGGMALQKGLGSAHAMATPLGELHLHHGTLIGVLLPHVLTFNAPAVPEKMARIKQAANLSGDIDLGGWLQSLVRRLGLPTSLHEMGVDRGVLPEIAAKANLDHLSATNPRQVNEADYMNLLTAAWQPN